ncbi:MAG: ROK family protein [Myxococcales bacterium]|nr:ROK family protein [Myxococcales bacterium]
MMTLLSDDTAVATQVEAVGSSAPMSASSAPQKQPTESSLHTPFTLILDVEPRRITSLLIDRNGAPSGTHEQLNLDKPRTADALLAAIQRLIPDTTFSRIAVRVPGMVKQGVIQAASGLGRKLEGLNLQQELLRLYERPVCVRSQAEWIALGRTRRDGTEVVVTLGKTLGIAIISDGTLLSGCDLAKHPLWKSKSYQQCLGRAARKRLGNKKWSRLVRRALAVLQATIKPQRIYLSGREADSIKGSLPDGVERLEEEQVLRAIADSWCSDSLPSDHSKESSQESERSTPAD